MKENNEILKFLSPFDNDVLSIMKGINLRELLYYLEKYNLTLRENLSFDDNVTFGLELEFERAKKDKVYSKLSKAGLDSTWKLKGDGSLFHGAEINSPILKDKKSSWEELKLVCDIVKRYSTIGPHCGGHVHIGAQIIGDKTDSWLNFMRLWSAYENVIFRFAYGDFLAPRSTIIEYAQPIAKLLLKTYNQICNADISTVVFKNAANRGQAVNFGNVKIKSLNSIVERNTIEFRCPNGTNNPVIWQNYVNLFINLLLYCNSNRYNYYTIEKRIIENGEKYFNLELYNEIFLDQALELCDLIFTTNLDKIYFLRQYLKSFEVNNTVGAKAKTFTR